MHSRARQQPGVRQVSAHAALLRARRVLWQLLLCSLVLAPALGQMHRVLHGSGPAPLQRAGPQGSNAGEPPASAWAALFSGHHASDCQLLDALGAADGPASACLALASHPLPSAQPLAGTPAPRVARRAAPFQARAPPHERA